MAFAGRAGRERTMRIDSVRALPFVGPMRFLLFLWLLAGTGFGAVPPELAVALKSFRTDGPRGWAFTQTTEAEGRSLTERFDPAQRDLARWTLLQKDGHLATADERRDYLEELKHRTLGETAPKLTEQFDLGSLETVADTLDLATYQLRLKPSESGDKTAAFLRIVIVLHKPTQTIASLELSNVAEFAPTFGVKITEMRTVMTYSLPAAGRPSLPERVTTRLRGRAFWVKSVDAYMTVVFSDYRRAGRQ
jgi:hypothetical protein